MPDPVIDFEQARERLLAAQFLGLAAEAATTVLPDFAACEAALGSGSALSQRDVHGMAGYLERVLHTGLLGRHARTWAAALLLKLREVAGPALLEDERRLVEQARAALGAFDAVAYGTVSPEAMRAFVRESEVQEALAVEAALGAPLGRPDEAAAERSPTRGAPPATALRWRRVVRHARRGRPPRESWPRARPRC